jgi:tetratricopeptide (TPR) repeat protein
MLGFPDRALKMTDQAIALAKRLKHPSSIAHALFHTGLLHLWRQEEENVVKYAQSVLEIAGKHEFQVWKAVATCLHGAGLAGIDQAKEGLQEIKRGMEMYSELKNPPIFWPLLLLLQAESYFKARQPEQGLSIIDQSLGIFGEASGNPLLPEIYRLKGETFLLLPSKKLAEAESLFRQAAETAASQQTAMFELRAAISLMRLWQQNGRAEAGRQMLQNVFQKFNEGFATIDLKQARELLDIRK